MWIVARQGSPIWTRARRGVIDSEITTVCIGALWENGAWKIRELRVH